MNGGCQLAAFGYQPDNQVFGFKKRLEPILKDSFFPKKEAQK
jgi:hypothetical protein